MDINYHCSTITQHNTDFPFLKTLSSSCLAWTGVAGGVFVLPFPLLRYEKTVMTSFLARWNWSRDLWSSWELSEPAARPIPQDMWLWPFHQGACYFLESTNTEVRILLISISKIIPAPHQLLPPNPEASLLLLRDSMWARRGIIHHLSHHPTPPRPCPPPSQSGKPHPMPSRLQRF